MTHKTNIKNQFKTRAGSYNISANWITNKNLINAHIKVTNFCKGKGVELCCGSGILSRNLASRGWQMTGVDITKEMLSQAQSCFSVIRADVESLPLGNKTFNLAILRQALLFLDPFKLLKEVKRVLKDKGIFVISHTVPFSDIDKSWLKKVHLAKQSQLLKFYTSDDIKKILVKNGFSIEKEKFVCVRESIDRWLNFAPELTKKKKKNVYKLIQHAPENYKKLRNIKMEDGQLFENWNWVVFTATKRRK